MILIYSIIKFTRISDGKYSTNAKSANNSRVFHIRFSTTEEKPIRDAIAIISADTGLAFLLALLTDKPRHNNNKVRVISCLYLHCFALCICLKWPSRFMVHIKDIGWSRKLFRKASLVEYAYDPTNIILNDETIYKQGNSSSKRKASWVYLMRRS